MRTAKSSTSLSAMKARWTASAPVMPTLSPWRSVSPNTAGSARASGETYRHSLPRRDAGLVAEAVRSAPTPDRCSWQKRTSSSYWPIRNPQSRARRCGGYGGSGAHADLGRPLRAGCRLLFKKPQGRAAVGHLSYGTITPQGYVLSSPHQNADFSDGAPALVERGGAVDAARVRPAGHGRGVSRYGARGNGCVQQRCCSAVS